MHVFVDHLSILQRPLCPLYSPNTAIRFVPTCMPWSIGIAYHLEI
jgi:hypothetical protein